MLKSATAAISGINYTTLATGALGFTIALAWNDAISKAILSIFPATSAGAVRASIVYAIVVTILVIIVVAIVNHAKKLVHGETSAAAASTSTADAPFEHSIVRFWEPSMGAR